MPGMPGKGFFQRFIGKMVNPVVDAGSEAAKAFGDHIPTGAEQIQSVADMTKSVVTATGAILGFGVLGAYTLGKIKSKIQNDTRRKALLSDLMETDPIIGQADKQKVFEYYATIFHIAPKVSLDKNAVRELLQAFVKFGRVDMATLKMLADTESKATSREFSPLSLIGSI